MISDDISLTVTDEGGPDPIKRMLETRERELERMYKLGVLHGINAQSMAQVEADILTFEDYGWSLDG